MSHRAGDRNPRTKKNEDGDKSSKTTNYDHYRAEPTDWERYLTQGWHCILWNDDNHLRWAERLDKAGCGRNANIARPEKGDLSNDIHPIFARANWVQGTEDNLWKILDPALRLASKMLLSKAALAFFRQVLFGSERRRGGRTYIHYVAPEDLRVQEEEVLKCLDALALKLRLLFAATPADARNADLVAQNHAVHCVSHHDFGKDYFLRGNLDNLPEDNGEFHFLLINQAYAEFFTRYDQREGQGESTSPSDFVRTTFMLASSLVHEIGHAFYARDRTDGDESYEEPWFDLEQHNDNVELGYALEFAMFGVSMNAAIHPRHGVQLDWQPVVKRLIGDYIEVVDENFLTLPMDPTWMHSLMTQKFWDQLDGKSAQEQLEGLFVPTDVGFGATRSVGSDNWQWRKDSKMLTKFGHKRNEAALARKVRLRQQRDKRKKGRQPVVSVAAGRYELRSKRRRTDSRIRVAAGPIAV